VLPVPLSQIETFSEIAAEWRAAERESDKRAVWRKLVRGGWLHACRDAVQRGDRATLEAWLDKGDMTKQDIIQFNGAAAERIVRTHILCSLAACWARELASLEPLNAARGIVTLDVPLDADVSAALELMRAAWGAMP